MGMIMRNEILIFEHANDLVRRFVESHPKPEEVNDEMKEALMDIQDTMRTYGVRGRETPEENMHLTLAFIGDYDDPDYVKSIVDSIEIRPFDITLKGIGAFGDLWWAGI
jgi:2'-5' RNA ligase